MATALSANLCIVSWTYPFLKHYVLGDSCRAECGLRLAKARHRKAGLCLEYARVIASLLNWGVSSALQSCPCQPYSRSSTCFTLSRCMGSSLAFGIKIQNPNNLNHYHSPVWLLRTKPLALRQEQSLANSLRDPRCPLKNKPPRNIWRRRLMNKSQCIIKPPLTLSSLSMPRQQRKPHQ
ncbi:hypothetical protein Mettu_0546 [Methylobacter tundripaludum SV96]|uniref:Uncharacterized protein n=1 Tax=Methylobacter tundripaludum (strain ATCC BAA-1195 / DSM 17260 / SV96) TaxID=697282 RepID=G3IVM8_METTV|nr:hypothetical protein Mettu_0546 [Methylobacter tundripaludum SV96]